MSPVGRCVGVAAGIILDELVGEPPDRFHPMIGVGRALARLERLTYRSSVPAGIAHTAIAVAGAWHLGRLAEHRVGSAASTALVVWIASSGRLLRSSAAAVGEELRAAELTDSDLGGARSAIRSLVGRDSSALNEGELVRAAVESVAENTVDAVVGTVFWGLAAGPAGVAAHRVSNTLDAMVGHRSQRYQRFGWASARLDDLLNFIPARLSAATVMMAAPNQARSVVQAIWSDGHRHPSPNGGRIEAAFAGALGISLGGVNRYGETVEVRGPLGVGPEPVPTDIGRANNLSLKTSRLAGIGLPVLLAGVLRHRTALVDGTCRAASTRTR